MSKERWVDKWMDDRTYSGIIWSKSFHEYTKERDLGKLSSFIKVTQPMAELILGHNRGDMFSPAAVYCGVYMQCLETWPPSCRYEESKTHMLSKREGKDTGGSFGFC